MAELPLRSSTLPRRKTNPKGLHTMYACLSGVKPRRALTPACQKTNPKGLLFYFIEFSSDVLCSTLVNNFIRFIFLILYPLFLLLLPHLFSSVFFFYSSITNYLCLYFIPRIYHPQITPSGLVFWQGRVKLQSGLTLHNAPQR